MPKSFGDILAARAEREKREREAAAIAQDATVAPDATVAQHTTVAPCDGLPSHRATVAPGATVAPDAPPPPSYTIAQRATIAPLATVIATEGYWEVPHTVTDALWKILDPYQTKVYMRLLRLTRGFRRETCRVGQNTLAESCGISKRKVEYVLPQLEAMGLIERVEVTFGADKGTTYRVFVPGETIAQRATVASRTRVAQDATVAHGATMKINHERKHERAPVAVAPAPDIFEIRTIAARLFEAHRGEAGFDHDRLRELVREALIGQGSGADETVIEEAIRGMAP